MLTYRGHFPSPRRRGRTGRHRAKGLTPREAAELLYRVWREDRRDGEWLSIKDAVADTGLPFHLAQPALVLLAGELAAEIISTDGGELRYRLESLDRHPFRAERDPAVQEKIDEVVDRLLSVGRVAFGTIASMLFALIFFSTGMFLAQFGGFGMAIGWPFLIAAAVFSLPLLITAALGAIVGVIAKGFATSAVEGFGWSLITLPVIIPLLLGYPVMYGFYQSMFERVAPWFKHLFNFGGTDETELADEARFIQLARARRGEISLGDLMVLYGWSRDEAFRQVTRLVVDYDGDIRVGEDGHIRFVFEHWADEEADMPEPVWVNAESPADRIGPQGRKAGPYALVFSALAGASVWFVGQTLVGSALLERFPLTFPALGAIAIGLVAPIPLLVMVRSIYLGLRTSEYRVGRRKAEQLRAIVEGGGRVRTSLAEVDDEVVLDFEGSVNEESSEHGEVSLEFPEIALVASDWS